MLYPTFGLAVGRFVAEHWAIAACRAYNTWLYEKFTSKNSRLKGMALLPIQDVEAAVAELRRAVKEFGMLGGMLPSNGEGIKDHLGAKVYWPIYEEAEKLGCALAVHVGSLHHLGMDGFSTYYPVHALGHPFGIAIQAAGLLAHGIFERFPEDSRGLSRRRLDLGAVFSRSPRPFVSSRATCKWTWTINSIGGPKPVRRRAIICVGRCATAGSTSASTSMTRVWGSPCRRPGREAFVFGSDFPHEVFNAEKCRHEIDQLLARGDLNDTDKAAVLGGNARRFYGLDTNSR